MRQDLQISTSNPQHNQLNRGLQEMVRSLPEPRLLRLPALISLSGKMGSGKDTVWDC